MFTRFCTTTKICFAFYATYYIHRKLARGFEREKQEYARMYLDKMWNQAYSNKLIQWENIVFGNARLIFEFPQNSGSGFKFQISNNSGFSEIQYQDNTERGYFQDRMIIEERSIEVFNSKSLNWSL